MGYYDHDDNKPPSWCDILFYIFAGTFTLYSSIGWALAGLSWRSISEIMLLCFAGSCAAVLVFLAVTGD